VANSCSHRRGTPSLKQSACERSKVRQPSTEPQGKPRIERGNHGGGPQTKKKKVQRGKGNNIGNRPANYVSGKQRRPKGGKGQGDPGQSAREKRHRPLIRAPVSPGITLDEDGGKGGTQRGGEPIKFFGSLSLNGGEGKQLKGKVIEGYKEGGKIAKIISFPRLAQNSGQKPGITGQEGQKRKEKMVGTR